MLKHLAAVLVIAVVATSAFAEKTTQAFDIPEYGELTLRLPADWEATLDAPTDGSPIHIRLVDHGINNFTMVVTHMNPPKDKEPVTPERILKMAKEELAGMRGEAKEKDITLTELKGPQVYGQWFALTRTAKKAANLSHATHFRVAVGDRLILGGTIVQVHKSGPGQREGLEVLKTATLKPPEAK